MIYGSLTYSVRGRWILRYPPHIMIKVKGLFAKTDKFSFGEVQLSDTDETAKDIRWFIERYPVEMEAKVRAKLFADSDAYDAMIARMHKITSGPYQQIGDAGLAEPLRDYQAQARDMLWERFGMLCADELGLGKSVTAISTLLKKGLTPALIICKTHLVGQWVEYLKRFLPNARVHVIKTTRAYDLQPAHVYIGTYSKVTGWVDKLGACVKHIIIDECQELRHAGTKKHKAISAIRGQATHCIGLSATPIFNYGGEMFNVMEVIKPGCLGSWSEFTREWCTKRGQHWVLNDPDTFGAYLRAEFLMVLRTRKQVGRELPPIQTLVREIEYNVAVLDNVKADALELARTIMFGSFTASGQAARELDIKLRQATGIAKAPFVAAFVQLLVWEGQKVLLTGWHRAVYDVWLELFRQKGIKCVMFTGSESPAEKAKSKAAFLEDANVMIISNRSGDGLDGLQDVCSTIVHGELDWSPQAHTQLTGRLFRDGQGMNVQEYYLVCNGGSDPILVDVLGIKKDQSRGILTPGVREKPIVQAEIAQRVKELAKRFLSANKH